MKKGEHKDLTTSSWERTTTTWFFGFTIRYSVCRREKDMGSSSVFDVYSIPMFPFPVISSVRLYVPLVKDNRQTERTNEKL